MGRKFEIRDERAKAKLIGRLRAIIQEDCKDGVPQLARQQMEDLAAQMISGVKPRIPAKGYQTLHENTRVREAILTELIGALEKMTVSNTDPLTLERLHTHFLLSATFATAANDDYSRLILQRTDIPEIPKEMEPLAAMAGKDPKEHIMSLIPIPKGTQLGDEEIKCIELRLMTVRRATERVFDAFYQAATDKDEIRKNSNEYRDFAKQAQPFVHPGSGRGS